MKHGHRQHSDTQFWDPVEILVRSKALQDASIKYAKSSILQSRHVYPTIAACGLSIWENLVSQKNEG